MATHSTLVHVYVDEEGWIKLPTEVRDRLGIKEGDVIAVEETPEDVLLTPRGVAAINALAEIGDALREQGLTLEDMIERGKAIREELYREQYGIADANRA